jgi:alanyl-tRNA synthetase
VAKPLTIDALREAFLSFYEARGHRRIPSSPLVPHGDPSLLFTSAGMVQFKPYFMGLEEPPASRMTSVQKCFRTTDVENIGDASHLTFFEMLGNFSIADYFKAEAIDWAWQFLTGVLEMDPADLWATVYVDDDEAYDLWKGHGLPEARILRYTAEQGNYWYSGETGPSGPCSELHYDFG